MLVQNISTWSIFMLCFFEIFKLRKKKEKGGRKEGKKGGRNGKRDRERHTSEVTAGRLDPRALGLGGGLIPLGSSSWFPGPPKKHSDSLLLPAPEPWTGTSRLRSMLGCPLLVISTCLPQDIGHTRPGAISCRDQPRVRKERESGGQGTQLEDAHPGQASPSLRSKCHETLRALDWVKLG